MTFAKIIEQVTSSAKSQNNILTDGLLTCSYQEIPAILKSIDNHFLKATTEIGLENHLAFECANSVPGALILLYLLKQGYSLVLLPSAGTKAKEPGFKPAIPKFCQYRITVKASLNNESGQWMEYPENFLRLEKNDQFYSDHAREWPRKLSLRTSGSMGTSKIVVHSQAKLVGNALNCVQRFKLKARDRIVIPVPIFHMYGLGAGFLPAIIAGASIDLQVNTNIIKYLAREEQFNPNTAFLTPALCEMLVRARKSPRPYKLVVTATDKIKEETIRAFDALFGSLVNLYGSTELGAIAACEPNDSLDVRATTAKPMPNVQMRVDGKNAESDDEARIGELYCQHKYGFEAYVDEKGNKLSQAPEWFKTGDLGKVYKNGYVEALGRCDNSVNRSGFLVLFSDIENAMEKIENVEQVVVVATQEEDKRGQQIAAFCVPSQGAVLSDTQIRGACFNILPKYAIPDNVFVVDSWPTLPSGKVDRQAIIEMAS